MIIHSALARHVCVLLGYLYPALASAKTAVQQDPKAFTQWMTYWVVISVFAMGEILFDFFVSWVPLYYEAKVVLIVWLTLPRYQGANRIYQRFLHPYMVQYEGNIDNSLEGMRVEATRRIQSLGATAANEIARAVTRQGTSAKDQLLARVLGAAVSRGDAGMDDRVTSRSAPPSPMPRRVFEDGDNVSTCVGGDKNDDVDADDNCGGDADEEGGGSDARMLSEFMEIMKAGVFAKARGATSLVGGDGEDESWRPRKIRSLCRRQFSISYSEEMEGSLEALDREEGEHSGGRDGAGEGGEGARFEVLAARADSASDESLVLETDRGTVHLSLPTGDDRDTLLIGFELLLSSNVIPDNYDAKSPSSVSNLPGGEHNAMEVVDDNDNDVPNDSADFGGGISMSSNEDNENDDEDEETTKDDARS